MSAPALHLVVQPCHWPHSAVLWCAQQGQPGRAAFAPRSAASPSTCSHIPMLHMAAEHCALIWPQGPLNRCDLSTDLLMSCLSQAFRWPHLYAVVPAGFTKTVLHSGMGQWCVTEQDWAVGPPAAQVHKIFILHLPPSYAQVAVKQQSFKVRANPRLTCCSSVLLSACASSSCTLASSSCPRSCCRAALYSGISACTSALGCDAASLRTRAPACRRSADQGSSQGSLVAGCTCALGCSAALLCARASACRGIADQNNQPSSRLHVCDGLQCCLLSASAYKGSSLAACLCWPAWQCLSLQRTSRSAETVREQPAQQPWLLQHRLVPPPFCL